MATYLTQHLKLRVNSNLTADAKYNLEKIDSLGSRFSVAADGDTNIKSPEDILVEPHSADVGGSGAGGKITIGTERSVYSDWIDAIINAKTTKLGGKVGLRDQAGNSADPLTKYLNIQYKSDLSGSKDTASDRTLSIDMEGGDRDIKLGGNVLLDSGLSIVGTGGLTLSIGGSSSLTLPLSGTIATLLGVETFQNKTIDANNNTLLNIANANISSTAAIAYSKLNLSNSILNSDVSPSAAIARSKLASGPANHVVINDSSGVMTSEAALSTSRGGTGVSGSAVFPSSGTILSDTNTATVSNKSLSGITNTFSNIPYSALTLANSIVNADISNAANISYSKLNLSNSIVNTDIQAGAAIALSKLASLTQNRALVSDSLGVISASNVSAAELNSLIGVTSNVQSQFASKLDRTLNNSQLPGQASGDLIYASSSSAFSRIPIGSNGQVLRSNGTTPYWSSAASGDVSGPNSVVDRAISVFNGTSGKVVMAAPNVIDPDGSITFPDQAEARFYEDSINGTNWVALRAPSAIVTSYSISLPVADGLASQALVTDGAGQLTWTDVITTDLNQYHIGIGNSANIRAPTDTNALGDILASVASGLTIKSGVISDTHIAASAAIDASKIADGSVSNTEFQYLDGLTGNIQTQLDSKLDDISASTDNAIVRWDGATGTAIQDSTVIISDVGDITGVGDLTIKDTLTIQGDTSGSIDIVANSTGSRLRIGDSSKVLDLPGKIEIGDYGFEVNGVNINGTIYDVGLHVNDIGGNRPAQIMLHRHSTTWESIILGARSNTDDNTHAAVTADMDLLTIYGAGHTGNHYDIFGAIRIRSDDSGTISPSSSPGQITFEVTPNGLNFPLPAVTIRNNKVVRFHSTTASTVPYIDANKDLVSSAITPTELGYLSGVTSNIQTQLDGKEPLQTHGNISTTTSGVTIGSGTGSTVGPNVTVDVASASISAQGLVQLSNSYTGSSQTLATTEKALSDSWAVRDNRIAVVSPLSGTTTYYTTLQAAFNAIPAATNASEARQVYTVHIPSGTYDEDVTIQINNRRINVICHGSVALGALSGSSWGTGGTPRNLTIHNDGTATIDGIRSGIAITSASPLVEGMTTHQSYLSKFRISGDLILTSNVGISSEFNLEVEVFGNMTTSGYAGNCNLYVKNSRFRGTFGGNSARLQAAYNTRFDGLVTVNNYTLIKDSYIGAGMTVNSTTIDLNPDGIFNTYISGTFTGPASSLRVDPATNYWIAANGVTLAGGATVVYKFKGRSYDTTWVNGDGATKVITHNLGTRKVRVTIYDETTYEDLWVDTVVRTSDNVVTLTASEAPGIGDTWRVIIDAI